MILSYRVEQQEAPITLDVLCPALNKGLQSNIVGTEGENFFYEQNTNNSRLLVIYFVLCAFTCRS